tara:strand:- start:233 stop:496 length:264 start_codon:yes stop_codon:yes gene_type:complete
MTITFQEKCRKFLVQTVSPLRHCKTNRPKESFDSSNRNDSLDRTPLLIAASTKVKNYRFIFGFTELLGDRSHSIMGKRHSLPVIRVQ